MQPVTVSGINKLFVEAVTATRKEPFFCLLDTGSEACIATMAFVKNHGLEESLVPAYCELQTFGNSIMATGHRIIFQAKFRNQPHYSVIEAVVDPSEKELVVLGQNFLRPRMLNIDFGHTTPGEYVLRTSKQVNPKRFCTPLFTGEDTEAMVKISIRDIGSWVAPLVTYQRPKRQIARIQIPVAVK